MPGAWQMGKNNSPDPVLPQNIEAERSVLGAILVSNSTLEIAAKIVSPADFYHAHHEKIFRSMLAMHESAQPIDLVTVCDFLAKYKQLDNAGGAAYLSQLMDGCISLPAHVQYHAEIIREKASLRRIIKQIESLQTQAIEGLYSAGALTEKLQQFTQAESAIVLKANGNGNGNGHLGHDLMEFLSIDFPVPEHLIEGLIPRGDKAMIVAMPHRMKSWFTTGLALAATTAGTVLGKLEVPKPVRTILVQVEDAPGEVQKRLRAFLATPQFLNCDPKNLRIIDRTEFVEFNAEWCEKFVKMACEWKADLIIFDVLRKFFVSHGDINSSTDTAVFLEIIDRIRYTTGAAVMLVHHENRKEAELMWASAGSYNLPGWATSVIQFKKKTEEKGVTRVEIEVDNKFANSLEPMRMVLDFNSANPLQLEALEEGTGFREAMDALGSHWTLRDLMEVLQATRSSANRRLKKWIEAGQVVKVTGKKGRGGTATYQEQSLI
jgi:DnaB-like helicase N terminal domain/AAA domain